MTVFLLAAIFVTGLIAAPVTDQDDISSESFETYKAEHPEEFGPYFEGDIEDDGFRNGILSPARRWPGAIVYYEIDPNAKFSYKEKSNINLAIAIYRQSTCVQWIPRTWQRNHVFIYRGNGCSSRVGMSGGRQYLSLANGCGYTGTILHEMMHAIGFYHEQSRTDRDNYVTINYHNISPNFQNNFAKKFSFEITHLGMDYDYRSIMHYGRKAFSSNGLDTIVPKNRYAKIGQRNGFTPTDILKIKKMYNCR